MAIRTTINLLQNINRGISGVTRAPNIEDYPTTIDTPDLPILLTWPAEATWHHKGFGGAPNRQDRVYRIVAFIEPLGQSDIPSRAVEAVNLLQNVIEAYLTPSNIPLADPPMYQVTLMDREDLPQTDSGLISNLMYRGTPFHGFEARVNVRELWTDPFIVIGIEIATTLMTANSGDVLCLVACRVTSATGTYLPNTYAWTCSDSIAGQPTTQTGAWAYFIVLSSLLTTTVTLVATDAASNVKTTTTSVNVSTATVPMPNVMALMANSLPNFYTRSYQTTNGGAIWQTDEFESPSGSVINSFPAMPPLASSRVVAMIAANTSENIDVWIDGIKAANNITNTNSGMPNMFESSNGTFVLTVGGINSVSCSSYYSLDNGVTWTQYTDANNVLSDVIIAYRENGVYLEAICNNGKIVRTNLNGSSNWTLIDTRTTNPLGWMQDADNNWWLIYADYLERESDDLTVSFDFGIYAARYGDIDAWNNQHVVATQSFTGKYVFSRVLDSLVDTGYELTMSTPNAKNPNIVIGSRVFPLAVTLGYDPDQTLGGYPITVLFGGVPIKWFDNAGAGVGVDFVRIGIIE